MYTNIKGVQILISLLKQYNIKHIVISPGTRNTPLAHSVEMDDFFKCYSIVDERSAGYFALGIAEQLDVPVCVSCTAATATCNYLPAIKEAYERNIQLIALTADQDKYEMFHMEDQCIDQVDMFHGYVNYAVDVPKITNKQEYWYYNRCVNEAFLELNHRRKGPIQINYHMPYTLARLAEFDCPELPVTRKIDRYEENIEWKKLSAKVMSKKRILIVAGSDYIADDRLKEAIKSFTEKCNCVVLGDTFSNVFDKASKYVIKPLTIGDVINKNEIEMLRPELIISFGNVYYSTMKFFVKKYCDTAEHWQISTDGMINDGFHCLRKVFECRPEVFFEHMSSCMQKGCNDEKYYQIWKQRIDKIQYPDLKFTNFEVIRRFCERIPENSNLHASVLDAIRMSNYVEMNENVNCFANIGADGIDGALSTFLGQTKREDSLSFLLIGDLSLLYDMNAMLGEIHNNIRILVINNYAGAEFHKNFGVKKIPTLDRHIAAGHKIKIAQCAVVTNAEYIQAYDDVTFEEALDRFVQTNDRPIILEVFTNAVTDADTLKEYWKSNKVEIKNAKYFVKKIVGEKGVKNIKKILKKH